MQPFDPQAFEKTLGGKPIRLYTLRSKDLTVTVHNYGCVIVQLLFKGKDLVLGYDTIDKYITSEEKYFSAVVGPVCNRICPPTATIDGQVHTFKDHLMILHGDALLTCHVWDVVESSAEHVTMRTSFTNALNFPGKVDYEVKFSVAGSVFRLEINAVSDKATILNCTSHPYFNFGDANILNHTLQINAEQYLEVDDNCVSCRYAPVKGTPFDFTAPKKIGQDLDLSNEQLRIGVGYDHNMCVTPNTEQVVLSYADVTMRITSNQPGIQFYNGGCLTTKDKCHQGKYGVTYGPKQGVCLETQHYPNTCNEPTFPQIHVKAGDKYVNWTEFAFE
ncbi:Aldose 1-epimerase [Spironucleus salmonicida]|nr:Aldose 1-epimerase [Spironucleus salmonicida]|eukprot:EST47945.1 Aldose 1-epimerase [Spironucleus salmonicida]